MLMQESVNAFTVTNAAKRLAYPNVFPEVYCKRNGPFTPNEVSVAFCCALAAVSMVVSNCMKATSFCGEIRIRCCPLYMQKVSHLIRFSILLHVAIYFLLQNGQLHASYPLPKRCPFVVGVNTSLCGNRSRSGYRICFVVNGPLHYYSSWFRKIRTISWQSHFRSILLKARNS